MKQIECGRMIERSIGWLTLASSGQFTIHWCTVGLTLLYYWYSYQLNLVIVVNDRVSGQSNFFIPAKPIWLSTFCISPNKLFFTGNHMNTIAWNSELHEGSKKNLVRHGFCFTGSENAKMPVSPMLKSNPFKYQCHFVAYSPSLPHYSLKAPIFTFISPLSCRRSYFPHLSSNIPSRE